MDEARSFVTSLQDTAIMIEHIMCKNERYRFVTVAG